MCVPTLEHEYNSSVEPNRSVNIVDYVELLLHQDYHFVETSFGLLNQLDLDQLNHDKSA